MLLFVSKKRECLDVHPILNRLELTRVVPNLDLILNSSPHEVYRGVRYLVFSRFRTKRIPSTSLRSPVRFIGFV